ncbi:MAG: prevent-host-death protein [Acidobacteriota bacterium]
MRQVSLREFRTRGSKVLKSTPAGETILLSGRDGPEYFLVPVLGDLAVQDRELRRAMARASLHENWRLAEKFGPLSEEAINAEIAEARSSLSRRRKK